MTNKVYPQIEVKNSTLENEVRTMMSTWVRLKRKGQYYLVYVSDNFTTPVIVASEIFPKFPKKLMDSSAILHARFIELCLSTKYYWVLPDDITIVPYVSQIGGEPFVKLDNNHLSDKENFMTNFRPYIR